MKTTLIEQFIKRKRRQLARWLGTTISPQADGSVRIRRGLNTITLSHSDYLLINQLKDWQQ